MRRIVELKSCRFSSTLLGNKANFAVPVLRRLLGALLRRLNHQHGQRKADFHHVVHQHFDIVNAAGGKLDLREYRDVRSMVRGVLERKFYLAFAQHRGLIRGNKTHILVELANASRPAIEHAEFEGGDRHLRHTHQSNDTHEDEIAIRFGAHVFAQQRALQVGENSCRVHDRFCFQIMLGTEGSLGLAALGACRALPRHRPT